ncbi:hypothetical protein Clacol_005752 [Clathrus columnatus]|uniref:ELMO domain-containing protein n=1 Tax=Clathrus columnatus TaxID=1419009 RepID=A0AAV5AA80_9AGAM|nr:hypothetical protein Clacol_005752 [Clathrus columnatus]
MSPSAPPTRRSVLVPTNSVTTKDGITDVADVIKQLCLNLQIQEPYTSFALRDDSEELVTDENLKRMIKQKAHLRLVSAPKLEALDIVEKLTIKEEKSYRLALFSLQRYIREDEFAREFLARDGLQELIQAIMTTHGNMLAYALTTMQNLMELDYGWSGLGEGFIATIVRILSSQNPINVCRPATTILKKLVEADPRSAPGPMVASSSTRAPPAPPHSVYRYGFDCVYEQMSLQRNLLEIVVGRLGSADSIMGLNSMMLINSLLSHATDASWEDLVSELERLNIRKAVVRLMSSHISEDLTSSILDFQANIVRVTYRRKTAPVDPQQDEAALRFVWSSAKLPEIIDSGELYRWRRIGFTSEDIRKEFSEVGALGLDCLINFVKSDPDYFAKVVLEQVNRPIERRCPVVKASNEIVALLAEYWSIFAPGYSTSTEFQPFFLNFTKVHTLVLKFFLRMWNESGAATADFGRVISLARSQVNMALKKESTRQWHEVETAFLESEYRDVRDRQMKELELEDDLLNKVPVRNLRAKLYKESFEFVRQQRIQCLLQGAWFINGIPVASGNAGASREALKRPNRTWRFMRMDKSARYIHYVDAHVKFQVRAGLEDLPERIEVAQIAEIGTGTCIVPSGVHRDADLAGAALTASPLSFSLYSSREGTLADVVASDGSYWADWTDGLNLLRKDGGHVATEETAGFVNALTEIGLKVKLLNLSGEKVEIPSSLVAGPPPPTVDFFYADPGYIWQQA